MRIKQESFGIGGEPDTMIPSYEREIYEKEEVFFTDPDIKSITITWVDGSGRKLTRIVEGR